MVVGCQPHASAAFTPRDIPGTHFHEGLYVRIYKYIFPRNCLSLGQHVYYEFSDMFRLIIIAILREDSWHKESIGC
jgi:hypothetical protein